MDSSNDNKNVLVKYVKKLGFMLLLIPIVIFLVITHLIIGNWEHTLILTLIVAIALSVSCALVSLPIKKFVGKYNEEIMRIKEGDFSALFELDKYSSNKVFSKITSAIRGVLYEFKELIESSFVMIKLIFTSTEQVDEVTNQSVSAMEEISKTLQDIAVGATEQAAQGQNCEALMETLSHEIEIAYSNCNSMMNETQKINRLSDEGSRSLNTLHKRTKETEESTQEIIKAVNTLMDKIKDIAIFVDSIENIASQTNLLALNAAIEAARAGDAGRGFGVVAEEIRKLADESRSATDEIKNLVQGIHEQSEGAIDVMETMNKATNEEAEAVDETAKAFKDINAGIHFIVEKIDHTNESISKVNCDKEGVISAIRHISGVAQSTAAYTEEVASTAEDQVSTMERLKDSTQELKDQVSQLGHKVSKYKI